ncbi:hypothetical protein HGM15179_021166, partial [Zosterops borbonicus]
AGTGASVQASVPVDISLMEEAVVELNSYLSHENGRLQELADALQEKHRVMSQEVLKGE